MRLRWKAWTLIVEGKVMITLIRSFTVIIALVLAKFLGFDLSVFGEMAKWALTFARL
jgi:hypothetical protein